jgi:hypothetical protein
MSRYFISALLLGDSLASSWFVRLFHRLTPWPRILHRDLEHAGGATYHDARVLRIVREHTEERDKPAA